MILRNMQDHSSALVQQAIMVSEELIRVAILWHEQWHEGLEDASRWGEGRGRGWGEGKGRKKKWEEVIVLSCSGVSNATRGGREGPTVVFVIRNENLYTHRLYFGEHNVAGMFTVLEPLHLKMEKGPETLKEISFNHVSSFVSPYPSPPSSISISSLLSALQFLVLSSLLQHHPPPPLIPLLPSSPSSPHPPSSPSSPPPLLSSSPPPLLSSFPPPFFPSYPFPLHPPLPGIWPRLGGGVRLV